MVSFHNTLLTESVACSFNLLHSTAKNRFLFVDCLKENEIIFQQRETKVLGFKYPAAKAMYRQTILKQMKI